jgi:DNA-binding transcriptional MocR family regulator
MWTPDLTRRTGPRYAALAEAIAEAVRAGRLQAGARLPTQRALAHALGLNLTTVTRAYALATEMGVVTGEVGRGTYVRTLPDMGRVPWPAGGTSSVVDMGSNFPSQTAGAAELTKALASLKGALASDLLRYQTSEGRPDHRAAGTAWLDHLGLTVAADRLIVTSGTIHGVFICLLALCRPGDRVLVEELTSPAVIGACNTLNLRLEGVSIDEDGMLPEALGQALGRGPARAVILVPSLQNPTLALMPASRREVIAKVLRRRSVTAIEDDAYGALLTSEERPAPLASFAPDRVCYVTSLSKAVAPGLRVGWLSTPPSIRHSALDALRVSTWMTSPFAAHVAARWIEDGTALALAAQQRAEAARRQELALSVLGEFTMRTHPGALHVWLKLPEPWRSEEFTAYAAQHGAGVLSSEATAADSGVCPSAVRVSLCNDEFARLKVGLRILSDILCGVT